MAAAATRWALRVRHLVGLLACATTASVATAADARWKSVSTGHELVLEFHEPSDPRGRAQPVVLYLQNLAAKRIGTESDASIIGGLVADGFLVVTVDYAGAERARVPFINRDLAALRSDLQGRRLLANRAIDYAHIFIVPSGCRLKRDIIFDQGSGRNWAMDIIYPTKPERPVGTLLEFSCDNANRMGNGSLVICSDTILDGAATEGFAVAMADHPVAAPYRGLDPMPESAAKLKAAVRTLRAQSDELDLNGRIVPVGFSRGSGMALMLVSTHARPEFENRGEHREQDSGVQGAVVMSGRFTYLDLLPADKQWKVYEKAWGKRETNGETWRRQGALDYFQRAPDVPLFLTINCTEAPEALHQMDVLRRRLRELGADAEYHLDEEPRGHKVPLDPKILSAMYRYLHQQLNGVNQP